MSNNEVLQEQIDEKRREIFTDGYPISIGEIANLYRDGDLDVHPEFQRLFRWSKKQKSRLVESLLLGIPIPSIFVYQRKDGVWDVIDGVQRLSTILEFMGILKDSDGDTVPASTLVGTEYLPELEGITWAGGDGEKVLDAAQQRLIKRSSIDVKIVTRESDADAKYDLFQRLNTGGSLLSNQEVLNSLLVMTNVDFYRWVKDLAESPEFATCSLITQRQIDEKYDMELVLRILALKEMSDAELGKIGDLSDFISEWSVSAASTWNEERMAAEGERFRQIIDTLNDVSSGGAFRRFEVARQAFAGGFSVAAYEAIMSGMYAAYDDLFAMDPSERGGRVSELVRGLWSESGFRENSGMGVRANTRLQRVIPFARKYFTE